jgi:hypothetical protein
MRAHQLTTVCGDHDILAAWQAGIAEAARSSVLLRQVERYGGQLLPRFAAQYTQLRALPRRERRALQRRWKTT